MRRSYAYLLFSALLLTSCVSKKEFAGLQSELKVANDQLAQCDAKIVDYEKRINTCEIEKQRLNSEISNLENSLNLRQEQIDDFKDQFSDIRSQRDKQLEQVGDLTVLSQSANENIKET
ncbi:MAG: hypothetical protein KJP00_08655, partial [Bacteroidia bacterium]|nr:hypothetical protein [Bacteroidia bacterium]